MGSQKMLLINWLCVIAAGVRLDRRQFRPAKNRARPSRLGPSQRRPTADGLARQAPELCATKRVCRVDEPFLRQTMTEPRNLASSLFASISGRYRFSMPSQSTLPMFASTVASRPTC